MIDLATSRRAECHVPAGRSSPAGSLANRDAPAAPARRSRGAFTLIELLCVIVIIGILMSLLLPALFRAYRRATDMADKMEAGGIASLLREETRNYCVAHPRYRFESKSALSEKCGLHPKCRQWLGKSSAQFVPFDYLTPTNTIVLTVSVGWKRPDIYYFTRADLTIRPD